MPRINRALLLMLPKGQALFAGASWQLGLTKDVCFPVTTTNFMMSEVFARFYLGEEALGLVCFYFILTISKRCCESDQVLNNVRRIAWNLSLF